MPEQLPDVIADAALLTRALTALGADALQHSPPDRPPVFTAEVRAAWLCGFRSAPGAGATSGRAE
ncbi:hypothetical protein [Streptomyces sp. P5_D11]